MAIESSCEINSGRDGDWSVYTIAGDYKPKYVRTFQVITDNNEETQFAVLDEVGIAFYDAFPTDPKAVCTSKRARVSDDNPKHWIVTFEYTDTDTLVDSNIELDIGIHRYQVPFVTGYDASNVQNVKVLNSALMPFDPPPTTNKGFPTLNFVKYEAYVDLSTMLTHIATYNDTLNLTSFNGLGSRLCKMNVKGKRVVELNHYICQYHYEIEYNSEGWDKVIMNRGFHYLPAGVGPGKTIRNPMGGDRVAAPYPLAANGDKLAVGDTPTYTTFKEFKTVSWASLGLV